MVKLIKESEQKLIVEKNNWLSTLVFVYSPLLQNCIPELSSLADECSSVLFNLTHSRETTTVFLVESDYKEVKIYKSSRLLHVILNPKIDLVVSAFKIANSKV
jgi:hypothetical protein